jgi:hypothetical protein
MIRTASKTVLKEWQVLTKLSLKLNNKWVLKVWAHSENEIVKEAINSPS